MVEMIVILLTRTDARRLVKILNAPAYGAPAGDAKREDKAKLDIFRRGLSDLENELSGQEPR